MKKSGIVVGLAVVFLLSITACETPTKNMEMPNKLEGVSMQYAYSGGNEYHVKFEKKGISYQFKSGSKPNRWWGPFKYNHMITEGNEHFVSWFEPGYNDYVTLLVNFDQSILYGSAIISGKTIHFQKAIISKTTTIKQ